MSFTFNRTNNKIIKKTVSLTSNPTINTNVFEETYQIVSATNSTINLPDNSNNTNNYYNNWFIRILSGLGINQIRQIQSYNSSTKQLALKTNLDIIPASSDSIILYNKLNSNIIWQESNNRFAPVYIKNSSNLNQIGETIEYLDFGCNNLTILSNKQSNSISSGSLIVNGGCGISGTVNIGNTLNVNNSINCNSLSVNGISITGNSSNIYLTDITPGTALASKALILNSSKDITGINSLTTTTLISTNLTLNGTSITASATEINKLTGTMVVTSDFNKLASITASATELNYNDITTIGTAEASKALIVDANKDIISIRNLTATNLTGTIQTASQPNITSVGTLTSLTTGNITLNGTLVTSTATELNYNDITTIGTAQASKALIVDSNKDIQSIRRLHLSNISIGTIDFTNLNRLISAVDNSMTNGTARYLCFGKSYTTYNEAEWGYYHTSDGSTSNRQEFGFFGANGIFAITAGRKVGINKTNPSYDLDVSGDINLTGSIRFSGTAITASAAELNYNDITTIGTAEASKALIVDANKDIISIRNLTATNLTGTIQTASQPNITSVGTLTSLISSGNILSSTANVAFRIVPHTDNIVYLQVGLTTTSSSAADLFIGNYNNSTTTSTRKIIFKADGKVGFGTVNPGYTLDVTGDINLTGSIRFSGTSITASAIEINKLTGTTAITSDFNKLASITASATELNYNNITTIGTAEEGKALIVDTNKDIISIRNLTATNLTGTIQTASQPNITSVGTLISLTSSGNIISSTANASFRILPHTDNIIYLQAGLNTTTGSAADLFIGNYAQATNLSTRKIIFKADGKVGLGTASPGYTLDVIGDINLTGSLRFSGTSITASATELNYLDFTIGSPGTAEANKALVLNSTLDITGINNLTTTTLISTNLTLNGTSITASAIEINKLTGTTAVTSDFNKLASITATATELNYTDITTIGTAQASKALIVDTNKDIISIRNLTATNLTGTIKTASQTNITSVGTLTGLTSSGQVSITNNTSSTNASTGALIVTGGIGNSGNINSGQIIKCGINNTTYNTIGTGGAYFQTGNSTITNSGATSSSTIATAVFSSFARPILAATNTLVTTTNASTIYIENEPLNGTNMTLSNSYALWVNAGKVLLGTGFGSTNKSIATLTINADTLRSNTEGLEHGLLISGGNTIANTCLYMGADNTNSVSYIQSSKVGANLSLILNNRGGNVGIGLNSPIYTLDVGGTINTSGSLRTSIAGQGFTHNDGTINLVSYVNNSVNIGTASFGTSTNHALIFQTNNIGRMTVTNSGNVGIGTTSPQGYLDFGQNASDSIINLYTNSTTNETYKIGANGSLIKYQSGTSAGHAWYTGSTTTSNGTQIMLLNSSGNLSLTGTLTVGTVGSGPNRINFSGTTGDANSNHTVIAERIYNNTEQSELLIFKGNDTPNITAGPDRIRLRAAEFRFQTYTSGEDYSGLNDNNDRLYIHYLGNIGIGTTSPGYTLDVNGSINANSILKSSSYITTDTYFYCGKSSSLSASIICNWGNSYHFGFGYDNTITNTIKVGICDSSGYWSGYANMRCNALYAQGSMSLSVAGYAYFRSDTVTGTVGATTANYSIYANGRIACNGEINVISDYRMKNTIEQLENQYCKDFINNTNPVKFNYNNDQSQKHFGYIAQDVYKAGFTDLVSLCPKEGLDEIIEDDGFINPKDIAFVMSTNELIPILAKNIKIIYNEKKILEDKVINLENENQQLKNQINNIIERLQILENN